MNYEQFLEKLKQADFDVVGLSYAFREFGDWQIAFIRFSGKYQEKDKISFIICARPTIFKGLSGEIVKESKEPSDYPFKLNLSEIDENLKYSFKLNFSLDENDRDVDWSFIYEKLVNKLPKILKKIGIDGLRNRILSQKDLNYSEKIWLEN
jgi:hypothetical protein